MGCKLLEFEGFRVEMEELSVDGVCIRDDIVGCGEIPDFVLSFLHDLEYALLRLNIPHFNRLVVS